MTVLPIIRSSVLGAGGGSGGGNPKPSGAPSSLPRASVWLGINNLAPDYYTIPSTGLNYPDGDWADILLIKLNNIFLGSTQHIFNAGQFGAGTNSSVCLYITSGTLHARIRTSAAQTINAAAPLTPGSAANGNAAGGTALSGAGASGWYIICLRRVGSNVEIATCPVGGAVTVQSSGAVTNLAAVTLNQGYTIGGRNDSTSINGQSSAFVRNQIAYHARVNATVTDANLAALAAGSDIMADLGFSPLFYFNYNTKAATITDTSGNNVVATKVNSPVLRGGPAFSTAAITLSQIVNGTSAGVNDNFIGNWYAQVFQRDTNNYSTNIIATGTYTGSPTGILVRVVSKTGTQISAPVAATYPSAGLWQATITVPLGAEYTLEAYWKNTPANIARSVVPWGVGGIVKFGGDSTADQQANGSAYTDSGFAPNLEQVSIVQQKDSWLNSGVYIANNIVCDPDLFSLWKCSIGNTAAAAGSFAADRAAHPANWTQISATTLHVDQLNNPAGSVTHTIDRYRTNWGFPWMAAFGAKTGACLYGNAPTNWNTYTDPGTHGKFKAMAYTIGGDVEKMFILLGANDGNNATPITSAQFDTAYEALIPQLRSYYPSRTAAQLPVHLPIVGRNSTGSSAVDANWRAARNGTILTISNVANCFDAGSMYDLSHANSLHPDVAGFILQGKRQAQSGLSVDLPLLFTTGMQGATVLSCTISGANTIDVKFTLNAGTTLQGLTGATGITGLTVTNAALVSQAYTSSIPAVDTVRLTFVGTPIAGWIVDYIPTQNPDVTNDIYTDASVVGSTVGVPVRPFTAPITL